MAHPIESYCPKCSAEPGQPCTGKYGRVRKAFHRGRGSRRSFDRVDDHGYRTDSPLEQEMAATLVGWIEHHGAEQWVRLSTQTPVGPYRADILIEVGAHRLVVECDGATYHNSADAVQRDKRRDRFFAIQGIAVMRFTGAEINRDPRGCAAQVGLWVMARR